MILIKKFLKEYILTLNGIRVFLLVGFLYIWVRLLQSLARTAFYHPKEWIFTPSVITPLLICVFAMMYIVNEVFKRWIK